MSPTLVTRLRHEAEALRGILSGLAALLTEAADALDEAEFDPHENGGFNEQMTGPAR